MFSESGKDLIFFNKKNNGPQFFKAKILRKKTRNSQQKYLNCIKPMKSSCFSHFTVYFNNFTEYYSTLIFTVSA